MKGKSTKSKLDIDSWLRTCIKKTYNFYREYSYSYACNLINSGQLFDLTSNDKKLIGRLEVLELNPGHEILSDELIRNIINSFNKETNKENRIDLDSLIYEYGINDFSCRLLCKIIFHDEGVDKNIHKVELLIPISPNILSPSLTGVSIFKNLKENILCIISNNYENSTLLEKHINYLKNISQNLVFLLIKS